MCWGGTIEKSYPCYSCGEHFLLPNQDLMVAEEVEEDKYPGAWKRSIVDFRNITFDSETYARMGTQQNVIKAVTGSRLLRYIESIRNDRVWTGQEFIEAISPIMKDHDKMLRRQNEIHRQR